MDRSSTDGRNVYCVVHIPTEGDEQLIGNIQRDARRIKRRIAGQHGLEVRLFVAVTARTIVAVPATSHDARAAAGRRIAVVSGAP
jgi:hypothetical protein